MCLAEEQSTQCRWLQGWLLSSWKTHMFATAFTLPWSCPQFRCLMLIQYQVCVIYRYFSRRRSEMRQCCSLFQNGGDVPKLLKLFCSCTSKKNCIAYLCDARESLNFGGFTPEMSMRATLPQRWNLIKICFCKKKQMSTRQ